MPTVSVGQVAQLSLDLLLNTYGDKVKKVGSVYSDAVLPITGVDRNTQNMCMALELHVCDEHKIVILQQRSPFVKGRVPSFRRQLLAWVKGCGFSEIVVLSGVSSHIRNDAELDGPGLRFLASSNDVREKVSQEFSWREYVITKEEHGKKSLNLPGSGILKSLYEDCIQEDISCCALLMFCNPGNTVHESMELIKYFEQYSGTGGKNGKGMRMPGSWNPESDEIKSNYIF